jgi:hypothetical protein
MNLNSYKVIPLALSGMLLAFSSQLCLAGDGAPTAAELANATYTGIEEGPVTLVEGRWEGEPYVEGGASRPSAGLVEDFSLAGDLNGDGSNETVVLIWQSGDGSGTFSYLAVMGRSDDEVKNLATAEIGDRVKLRSGRIDDDLIILDVLQQGEGDAACCPTQLATRTWSLVDGQLNEGKMKITGKSACNRYSAGVEQGEAPADLKIGPAMGTRMACPGELMDLEHKYLDALTHVTGFSFLAGKLVLTWEKDGNWSTMIFDPN